MNQTVLNVIELIGNNVIGVTSFIVRIEADDSKNQEDVALAENHFIELARQNIPTDALTDEDREYYLEEAIYDDDNGYVVQLVWSN